MHILTPEVPTPCSARPRRSTPKADVGAPVEMAESTIRTIIAAWMVGCRPNMSAACAQKGRKVVEVRLKAEMIQFNCLISSGAGRLANYI